MVWGLFMGVPLWLQTKLSGREGLSLWLGKEWVRFQDMIRAQIVGTGINRHVRITMKGGVPVKEYRGHSINLIKQRCAEHGVPE